eukprot:SAG31_NODE_935_length_10892_cov_7.109886_10_plen_258_part_00
MDHDRVAATRADSKDIAAPRSSGGPSSIDSMKASASCCGANYLLLCECPATAGQLFNTKKKAEVTNVGSLPALFVSVQHELKLDCEIKLEVFDPDFEEWIEPKSLKEVPTKGKVRVIPAEQKDTSPASLQQLPPSAAANGLPPEDTGECKRLPVAPVVAEKLMQAHTNNWQPGRWVLQRELGQHLAPQEQVLGGWPEVGSAESILETLNSGELTTEAMAVAMQQQVIQNQVLPSNAPVKNQCPVCEFAAEVNTTKKR